MLGVPELSEVFSNHLFYVDDLKIYALSQKKLDGMLRTVQRVKTSIGMSMGLSKCALLAMIMRM